MCDEAGIAGIGNRLSYSGVIQFLLGADFVAAGIAASVEVAEKGDVGFDCSNDVALHDLHVIDIEQKLDLRMTLGTFAAAAAVMSLLMDAMTRS